MSKTYFVAIDKGSPGGDKTVEIELVVDENNVWTVKAIREYEPPRVEPEWNHADMCDTVMGGTCNCYVPARRAAWLRGEYP